MVKVGLCECPDRVLGSTSTLGADRLLQLEYSVKKPLNWEPPVKALLEK